MTDDSPSTTRLPPARVRIVRRKARYCPRRPQGGVGQGTASPIPSLIGDGPSQYLVGCKNRPAFAGMRTDFDDDLQPNDAIERMWVDEIVDLSWDLKRSRSTRLTVVEKGLFEKLVEMVIMADCGQRLMQASGNMQTLENVVRGCVRGDPDSYQVVVGAIGSPKIEDALQHQMLQNVEVLARLGCSIQATARLRDTVLDRLYGRRMPISTGRLPSARPR